MLPEHLKNLGYSTHAIGKVRVPLPLRSPPAPPQLVLPLTARSLRARLLPCSPLVQWHLGDFAPQLTPTGRGFDTFYGYYDGAEEYFSHTIKGFVDLHNDSAAEWGLGHATGQDGAYSTHIYTTQAERTIARHAAKAAADGTDVPPLFMYLAYQAIHSPDEVPQSYRDPFNATIPDTPDHDKVLGNTGNHRRTVAGMVAALDEGIGNVTAALEAAGMKENTLIFFTAGWRRCQLGDSSPIPTCLAHPSFGP